MKYARIKIFGVNTDYIITDCGDVYGIKNPSKKLSQTDCTKGYPMVTLRVGNRRRTISVHRLVAIAFITNDNPDIKTQVNHIDGDKHNNHYTNLEWVTCSENMKHAFENGLKTPKYGNDHPNNKFNADLVHEICYLYSTGYSPKEIRKKLNISNKYLISNILSGKYWRHISSKYNINYSEYKKERSTTIENDDNYYIIDIHC